MSEAVLTVLKFCFLALLYLFLWRVVRVVISETREPEVVPSSGQRAAAKPERGRLSLRVIEPAARKGETAKISGEITVGRGGGCSLVLAEDTFVSQVHARVFVRDGKVYVEDLGSKNGTQVNGKLISGPARVRKGDRVQFGSTLTEISK